MSKLNVPFTKKDMENLHHGFNPSCKFLGMVKDEWGNDVPNFALNRRTLRAMRRKPKVKRVQYDFSSETVIYPYRWQDSAGVIYFKNFVDNEMKPLFKEIMTSKFVIKFKKILHFK